MPSVTNRSLPPRLEDLRHEIMGYAREFGLDFYEVVFEMLTYDEVNMVAAYGGYPNRYPHWRFGMDYEQLSKGYEYGLSKIYEMVINNDPTYAYLLESNPEVDQKLVMAHVYGHGDFFKHNFAFRHTNRKMMDEMANHATRVRRWIDRIGIEPVEDFIDRCLSLENLIDYHAPYIRRGPARIPGGGTEEEQVVRGLKTEREYMRDFINPPAYLADLQRRLDDDRQRAKRFPEKPQRDVLAFLLEHAPLEPWEADVLAILREEAYYFAPQGMTKIMNEGWACLAADTPVFTERGLLTMAELIDGRAGSVCDGESVQRVYDRNVIRDHETVRVTTRRGLDVTGSNNHRVLLADRVTWKRLDELQPGDRLAVSGGRGLWPEDGLGAGLPGRADPELPLPEAIRRAPRSVAAAYLRALFDAAGETREKVTLSTPSETLSREVQLLLLNFGILADRTRTAEAWQVHVAGASAAVFAREIGFGLARKQEALEAYVADHRWTKEERWEDEVVATEAGRADVYDISVEETHRYAAGGLVNHNSFWHSKIMTTRALKDSEVIDYADHHSGTVSMRPGSLNPYKIGIELYRDIEDRWNRGRFGKEWEECDDLRARQTWDRQLGLGRKKIFEVRRHYTDVTFIDEFLTPEFCLEHKLFVYGYNDKHQAWEILSRDFKAIKEKLLHQLTNFGQPIIEVVDGNFENRGELLLVHRHDGVDLKMDHARESLRNLQSLWRRPVNLHTRVDGKGLRIGFDGREFLEKRHEL